MDMARHKQGIQRLKQKFENTDTAQKVRTAELADLCPVDEAMCLEAGSFSTWEMKQMVILPHIGNLCPLAPGDSASKRERGSRPFQVTHFMLPPQVWKRLQVLMPDGT